MDITLLIPETLSFQTCRFISNVQPSYIQYWKVINSKNIRGARSKRMITEEALNFECLIYFQNHILNSRNKLKTE